MNGQDSVEKVVPTSWRSGEEGAPGCLAVAVGELRPVLQGEHPGGDGTAFNLICASRHANGRLSGTSNVCLTVQEQMTKSSTRPLEIRSKKLGA